MIEPQPAPPPVRLPHRPVAPPAQASGARQDLASSGWSEALPLHLLLVLGVVFCLYGTPMLETRRLIFMTALKRQWDPTWLENDWMFSVPHYNHLVFNVVFGAPTRIMPLEAVYWAGTLGVWVLLVLLLFRLGRHFVAPRSRVTLALLLWLIYDQAPVAHEYVFGTLEAKGVAYVFLLGALVGFLEGRSLLPAALLGFCFSFHAAVGMWGGLAAGVMLLVSRRPLGELVRVGLVAGLCAMPGFIPMLVGIFSQTPAPGEARFVARVLFPMHLDPMAWPKRSILLLYLMLGFNTLQVLSERDAASRGGAGAAGDPGPVEEGPGSIRSVRMLLVFQGFLALVFTAGLLARQLELYGFLRFFPFRLFPVFVMLCFFLHLARAWERSPAARLSVGAAMLGLVTLLSFGDPLGRYIDQVRLNVSSWKRPEDDVAKALRWVAANTPEGTVVIAPPWRMDAHLLSERAQVATWEIYAHDRPVEWRERMEAVVGKRWGRLETIDWDARREALREGYMGLSTADLGSIRARYGGDYLVSWTVYPYPVLFGIGKVKVYDLTGISRAPGPPRGG